MANREYQKKVIKEMAKMTEKRPPGKRKIVSTDEIRAIIERIGAGETLTQILKDQGMPGMVSFFNSLHGNEELGQAYKRARQTSATVLVERTIDEIEAEVDPAMAALLRVKSDARRWVAARFHPELFGETRRLELSGEVRHSHVLDLTREQRARIAQKAPPKPPAPKSPSA